MKIITAGNVKSPRIAIKIGDRKQKPILCGGIGFELLPNLHSLRHDQLI